MRVPCERPDEKPWSRALSIRISLPLDEDSSDLDTKYINEAAEKKRLLATSKCDFSRCSIKSMKALRSLPEEAAIVMFTPFVIPVGYENASTETLRHVDPFEPLGRALADIHANIQHVPYAPSVGFTETHRAFVQHCDAIITIVCEPEHPAKNNNISSQCSFAKEAAVTLSAKRTRPAGTCVLVLCGDDMKWEPRDELFPNVIQATTYNCDVAKILARTIMGFH